jgi:hypothetical protein
MISRFFSIRAALTLATAFLFATSAYALTPCTWCGTHLQCTRSSVSGATYYSWSISSGPVSLTSQQGNRIATFACNQWGASANGQVRAWTKDPSDGGTYIQGADNTWNGFCPEGGGQ